MLKDLQIIVLCLILVLHSITAFFNLVVRIGVIITHKIKKREEIYMDALPTLLNASSIMFLRLLFFIFFCNRIKCVCFVRVHVFAACHNLLLIISVVTLKPITEKEMPEGFCKFAGVVPNVVG